MATGKTWRRRLVWAVVVVVLLLGATVLTGLWMAERRMHRHIDVRVAGVPLVDDAAAQERGRYLYNSRGCTECHGKDGAGRMFIDDGKGMRVQGPNISSGPGSVVAAYTPQDWERSIRHGVAPGGRPLLIMPSEDYNRLSNEDFAALVAWLRHMPPAKGGGPVLDLPLPVRVLYGLGAIPDAASRIDHTLPPAQAVASGVTVEHGAYVAAMCIGCHGEQLQGGKVPGGPPDWPPAASLQPGPVMARYPDGDSLVRLFQTGKRPDGSAVQVMPFDSLRTMSETDVRALQLYLATLKSTAG